MKLNERIREIEKRARKINVPVTRICVKAKVPPGTYSRWRNNRIVDPKMSKVDLYLGRMERWLDRREAALMRTLECERRHQAAA